MATQKNPTRKLPPIPNLKIDASKSIAAQLEQNHRESAVDPTQVHKGWVCFIGRRRDGKALVQFNVNSDGWSSEWPEWALDLAEISMLNELPLCVTSIGPPFGCNLQTAIVLHRNG